MSLSKSAEEFKKFANSFKVILEFAEEINKFSNLEHERDVAVKQTGIAKNLLEAVNKELAEAKGNVAKAELKAQEIEKVALGKAESILNSARVNASIVHKDTQEKKEQLEAKVEQLKAEAAAIKDEIRFSKVEFEEIQNRITAVKKKLTDFVGQ